MNRAARFANARQAMVTKLQESAWVSEADLKAIASAELGPRAQHLVVPAFNSVLMEPDGYTPGADIAISSNAEGTEFSFMLCGGRRYS